MRSTLCALAASLLVWLFWFGGSIPLIEKEEATLIDGHTMSVIVDSRPEMGSGESELWAVSEAGVKKLDCRRHERKWDGCLIRRPAPEDFDKATNAERALRRYNKLMMPRIWVGY